MKSAKFFIVNSVGARPKNYAHLDASSMSEKELLDMLGSNSAVNSLPFLASLFGHRIFLLNRRGTSESQGHIGKDNQPYSNPLVTGFETLFGGFLPINEGRKKRQDDNFESEDSDFMAKNFLQDLQIMFNPRYWNYSLDEQVKFDLPSVIKYVLDKTGKEKVALVGHSFGSALVLSTLSEFPDLSDNGR